jgi:hypothetical protein
VYFLRFSQQTTNFSLNSINRLVLLAETWCVFCEVWTELLCLELLGIWTLAIVWYSKTYETTTFRKLDLCPSSCEGETPTLLRHLERANLSYLTINVKSQKSKSKSKLHYDWKFTANQFILAPSSMRLTKRDCACVHGAARLEFCLFRQCIFCHIHREYCRWTVPSVADLFPACFSWVNS